MVSGQAAGWSGLGGIKSGGAGGLNEQRASDLWWANGIGATGHLWCHRWEDRVDPFSDFNCHILSFRLYFFFFFGFPAQNIAFRKLVYIETNLRHVWSEFFILIQQQWATLCSDPPITPLIRFSLPKTVFDSSRASRFALVSDLMMVAVVAPIVHIVIFSGRRHHNRSIDQVIRRLHFVVRLDDGGIIWWNCYQSQSLVGDYSLLICIFPP